VKAVAGPDRRLAKPMSSQTWPTLNPWSLTICATLGPAQEALVVELRRTLLRWTASPPSPAPIPPRSLAGRRQAAAEARGRLPAGRLMPAGERGGRGQAQKDLQGLRPGYLHIGLKELPRMPDEADKPCLCVAVDHCTHRRATKEAFYSAALLCGSGLGMASEHGAASSAGKPVSPGGCDTGRLISRPRQALRCNDSLGDSPNSAR